MAQLKRFWSKETYIALLAAVGVAWYLIGRYLLHAPVRDCQWPLFAVLAIGGGPLIFDLLRKIAVAEFGADLLAGISIAASAILGEYLAGSIVVLMLSGGAALEQYATRRASAVLGALAKRMPSIAHRRTGSQIEEIGLADVRVNDLLVVFPHEICPVDGTVSEGHGTMDESYLTGEPYRISKVAGAEVLSGAVNGETALTIEVDKLPVDSRYAKITRVMQEAETNRPQNSADRATDSSAASKVLCMCVMTDATQSRGSRIEIQMWSAPRDKSVAAVSSVAWDLMKSRPDRDQPGVSSSAVSTNAMTCVVPGNRTSPTDRRA